VDATTISVLGGLGVATITGVTAIVVAFINNQRERTGSADSGIEAVLRQQLALSDDRLEAAHDIIDQLRRQVASCRCGGVKR
jgi:hypothetical protein